mgnify:CR=1 FL=1|tara:strand:- start:289 stop:534 length:246 start_codon:yes stop_codon:yes gene_type:complete
MKLYQIYNEITAAVSQGKADMDCELGFRIMNQDGSSIVKPINAILIQDSVVGFTTETEAELSELLPDAVSHEVPDIFSIEE